MKGGKFFVMKFLNITDNKFLTTERKEDAQTIFEEFSGILTEFYLSAFELKHSNHIHNEAEYLSRKLKDMQNTLRAKTIKLTVNPKIVDMFVNEYIHELRIEVKSSLTKKQFEELILGMVKSNEQYTEIFKKYNITNFIKNGNTFFVLTFSFVHLIFIEDVNKLLAEKLISVYTQLNYEINRHRRLRGDNEPLPKSFTIYSLFLTDVKDLLDSLGIKSTIETNRYLNIETKNLSNVAFILNSEMLV